MATYAALVSLMHIVEQIQNHPRPPISLDKIQIESLTKNVAFLQDFIESYSHDHGINIEADELESRIANAAYAAEDVIESHVVDQITSHGENISSIDLYQGLQKVMEEMGFIKKEVIDFKEKSGIKNQLKRNSTPTDSPRSPSTGQNTMVGFDDLLYEVVDKLTGAQLDRQIIPISGMGGIGKTTLARNIFINENVVHHFDIRVWATISQEYSVREVLLEIICQENKEYRRCLSEESEDELGEMLHKHLFGRRYLIIMDDMWVIDVWCKINCFFPDNNNGSRILITTRQSNVALQLNETHGFKMNFLDEFQSWNLLCKNVFEEEGGCPLELEEVGKKIAKNCKGLPLSIVVIGRVLAKSRQTQEYWEYIAENLSSIVNLEDDEHCLKILSTSYNQLPIHLKSCFLYMGVFNKDRMIHVSSLIKLLVAEGFLKPISGKSLEAVAEEYLRDLIDRNLIFIHQRGSSGKIKFCSMHDLLRDLCLRQAQREKFICVASQYNPDISRGINTQRRIAFHQSASRQALQSLQSASLVHSLICDFDIDRDLPRLDYRLLRVLIVFGTKFLYLDKKARLSHILASQIEYNQPPFLFLKQIPPHILTAIFSQLNNSRYLAISIDRPSSLLSPSLWNVQTLIVDNSYDFTAPSAIWKMPQLRHVQFRSLKLNDPPNGHIDGQDDFVLGNLQTLLFVKNFRCCEEVVKRIPNIKKLKLIYEDMEGWSRSCFDNLDSLKLESLHCIFFPRNWTNWTNWSESLQNLTFPHSLKKLTLEGCRLYWEDVTTKIGTLPLLEVLKLEYNSTKGNKWEMVEEGFPNLKFLKIGSSSNYDLECWTTDSTHFPILEHLLLDGLKKLENIPLELGNIPTLKLIELNDCSNTAVISAKEILDEQVELGNEDLQVRVRLEKGNEEVESFKSGNFLVEVQLNLPRETQIGGWEFPEAV